VPTPHLPASFVNSLGGAPEPSTLAYEWFSNAITMRWLQAGVVFVRAHGDPAASAAGAVRAADATTASTVASAIVRRRSTASAVCP
jgi:hypothetical protein